MKPHIVSNSSGETSGYLTYKILFEKNIDWNNVFVIFANTGEESPESLDFLHEQERYWGKKYYWVEYDFPPNFEKNILKREPTYENLDKYGFEGMYDLIKLNMVRWRDGEIKDKMKGNINSEKFNDEDYKNIVADHRRCMRDFYKLFGCSHGNLGSRYKFVDYKSASREGIPFLKMMLYKNAIRYVKKMDYIVPNAAQRFSTGDLKVKPSDNLLKDLGVNEYIKHLGIRADEENRYWGNLSNNKDKEVEMLLYNDGVDKGFIRDFWDNMSFQLQIRNQKFLGNCIDCYLKTDTKRILACYHKPDSFERLAIIEKAANDSVKRKQSAQEILDFVRNNPNKYKEYYKKYIDGLDTEKELSCMCG